jgi:hypothetical protein
MPLKCTLELSTFFSLFFPSYPNFTPSHSPYLDVWPYNKLNVKGISEHEQKFLKLWAKINLSSLNKLIFSGIFVRATESCLTQKIGPEKRVIAMTTPDNVAQKPLGLICSRNLQKFVGVD